MFREEADRPTLTREFFVFVCGFAAGLPAALMAIVFAVQTNWLTFIVHFGLRNPKLFFEIAVLNSVGSMSGFGIAAVGAFRLALNED